MSENNEKVSISPIKIKPEMKIKILDNRDLERIHEATLVVLKETGVKFPSGKALKILAEAGADVDFENQVVKFPPDLLMNSLAKAPRSFTMSSRGNQDLDLHLDGTTVYCGTSGTGTTTVGLDKRIRRASTKNDVAMMALITDYLSSVSFYWPMVSARDVPIPVISLHELDASFIHTEKHVHIVSCVEEKAAQYAVEMATVVAGGKENMKKRPPLSLIVCPISPLTQEKGSLDAALTFAEAGLPVIFGTMPVVGSTAPASLPGTMVVGNAETLSARCLIQLAYPATPVCYCLFHDMLNPFTGECAASALQKPLLHAGVVDLGHYYNLPVMSGYGASGARTPVRWEAGRDNAIDALYVCLTGPELLPTNGLLDTYTLLYPEKILFDDEIYHSIKYMTEGMRVDSETLAVDEIMAVGPGGHFLDREYTCQNIRKLWHPGISHQWSHEKNDFRDPQEAAVEKVQWILKNHKPKPLGEKIEEELGKIIKAAEKELVD